jgi:tetratricopeptide (TPR) repeat protein
VLLGAAVLAGAALATGAWLRWARPRPAPPVPPEVKADALEPAVLTAIGVARERVLKEPASAEAWGDLGKVFLANEMQDEANVCFARAEQLDAHNPRWPYFQGGTWQARGDYAAALPLLRRAADLCAGPEAGNVVPRLLLAETLLTLGRTDEADAEVRQAADSKPDDARVQFDRGLVAAARQDWPAAREHLRRCLGSPYARQKACVQLAAASRRLGEAPAARPRMGRPVCGRVRARGGEKTGPLPPGRTTGSGRPPGRRGGRAGPPGPRLPRRLPSASDRR